MPYSFQSLVIGHKTSTASIFKGKVHKVSWITANKLQRLLKNSKCCHEAPFLDSVQGLSKGKVSKDRLEREVPLQKTFVILSGVHILVVCYLKKLHDKSDIINAGVAGCITRLALRISGSPLAEEQPLHIEYRETVVPRGYFLECESQERGRISCIYPYKQAIGQALRQGFAEVRYEILWALKKSFTEDCQVVLIDRVQKRMARNLKQMPLRYGFLSTSPTQMQ